MKMCGVHVCVCVCDVCASPHRCVVAELFMDGRALFDLSQLLEYCSDDRAVDSTLKRVSDKYIRVGGAWGCGSV